jgi:MFS family permease
MMPSDRGLRTGQTPAQTTDPANAPVWAYLTALSLFLIFFVGGTLPSPIYLLLQQEIGFANSTLTGMFGVFYFGTTLALVLFGHMTDILGRRPLLGLSFLFSLSGATIFLVSDSVPLFFVARFLNGMASGFFSGAAVAAVAELHPKGDRLRAGVAAATATVLGMAFGPALAGLLINVAPFPTKLPFLANAAMIFVALVAVWLLPETASVGRSRTGAMKLRLPRVPAPIRRVFLAASLSCFAGWAGIGLYMALGPSLIESVDPGSGRRLGGFMIGAMMLTAGILQQSLRGRFGVRTEALAGGVLLSLGMAASCVGLILGSGVFFAIAVALTAIGHGFAWMSSSGRLNRAITSPDERGAILSAFYIVAYIGTGIPAFGMGFLADVIGLAPAMIAYAILTGLTGLSAALIPTESE